MLLETLDVKYNDVIIYSQNIFDTENNFKIVFKDDPALKHRNIPYEDVCKYINVFTPKNLIVYRLLTNIPVLNINSTRYGIITYINGSLELIYPDPIFAIKELEFFSKQISNIRFIIQQIGLTTLNKHYNYINFAELYAIDLEAIETKYQNDKVFAEAILLNSQINTPKEPVSRNIGKMQVIQPGSMPSYASRPSYRSDDNYVDLSLNAEKKVLVGEDKAYEYNKLSKVSLNKTANPSPEQEIKSIKITQDKSIPKRNDPFLDIFKSSGSFKEYLKENENKKVVLRLNK